MSKCGCFKKVHSNTSLSNGPFVVPNSITIQPKNRFKIDQDRPKIDPKSFANLFRDQVGAFQSGSGQSWSRAKLTPKAALEQIPIAYAIGRLGWVSRERVPSTLAGLEVETKTKKN